MKLLILELESDGLEHQGAEIDAKARETLAPPARELELSPSTRRSPFANSVDWAKAKLTEENLHEIVGQAEGQNIYRITAKGRDFMERASSGTLREGVRSSWRMRSIRRKQLVPGSRTVLMA